MLWPNVPEVWKEIMNVLWFMMFTDTWEYVTILEKFVVTRYSNLFFVKSPKEYPFYGRLWIHLMYHYQKCISYIESSKNLASKSLKARAMKVALCSLFFVNSPREKFFTVFKCPSKRNFYIFCCNNINTKKAQFFAWLRQKI